MKKTISIAAMAVTASTSFAFIGPITEPMDSRTYCVETYRDGAGYQYADDCDMSMNNMNGGAQVGPEGCTSDQVAIRTYKRRSAQSFPINIRACLPPNVAQL